MCAPERGSVRDPRSGAAVIPTAAAGLQRFFFARWPAAGFAFLDRALLSFLACSS